jgi:hypothetical protein
MEPLEQQALVLVVLLERPLVVQLERPGLELQLGLPKNRYD